DNRDRADGAHAHRNVGRRRRALRATSHIIITNRKDDMHFTITRNSRRTRGVGTALLTAALLGATACAPAATTPTTPTPTGTTGAAPSPDPRLNLRAGLTDAGEAIWNL